MRIPGLLGVVSLGACVFFGCSVNPVTGKTELVLMSQNEEEAIGAQAAERVEAEIGLFEDPPLQELVAAVGERVAAQSPRAGGAYRFQVVDMEEPNAFAFPGGYVYVSRGLLAVSNSEAELANVLGHEIAHVAARHLARRETAATGVGLLDALGGIVGSVFGEPAEAVSPFGLATGAIMASYSREQEREADEVGQEMAARAGIDPHGMPRFLRTLENRERLEHQPSRLPGFLDTHPATPERLAVATARADSLGWQPAEGAAADASDYLQRLDGLLLGPDPAAGVFHGNRFLHADLNLTIRFPEGWKTMSSRSAVGALSPNRDSEIALEFEGPAGDPRKAAGSFLQKLAHGRAVRVLASESLEIGGFPAYHAEVQLGSAEMPVAADFTWISHDDLMVRIRGITPAGPDRRYRGLFRKVARSFRRLELGEPDSILETRLRLVAAVGGETLAELSARSENAWDVDRTAVYNGLPVGSRLEAGRVVKVAVPQPYIPGNR
jgi:predicted Zn-dependent protease